MIDTLLIDDEEIAVTQLEYLLKQYPEIHISATFTDPITALEKIEEYKPELIFLDIKMPEISGLDVAEEIMQILPETYFVFVTAYDQYALNAFDYNAIDYILKPVSLKRIDQTVRKVITNLRGGKEKTTWVAELPKIRQIYGDGFNKIIAAEEAGKIILLTPSDVIMFTPQGRGAIIYTPKKTYLTKQSINYWEERLEPFNFFRCHKSYLVNFDKIEKILPMFNHTYLLKIANYPEEIPVSRSKAKELKKILGL
ncbi:LytTR family DNA-binding domain-containing protein [Desulfitobacterium sp.]|uniref:LytR/AlgR family response regulator transcription factor n=1 Tax=Desulfitobacterium sp. TaxID=49981 RepID=UPI002B1F9390|nr:LytTR family DNA-binding domain-containing protein [Desulfitobacterium sp.]MEA4902047.1 LytTR family DNA-binding domain-containing protein [Desulfitobacterium sp.]